MNLDTKMVVAILGQDSTLFCPGIPFDLYVLSFARFSTGVILVKILNSVQALITNFWLQKIVTQTCDLISQNADWIIMLFLQLYVRLPLVVNQCSIEETCVKAFFGFV